MSPTFLRSLRSTLTTPGWRRSQLLRRGFAAVLFTIAVALALNSARTTDPMVAVMTSRVTAGDSISSEQLELRAVPADLIPETSFTELDPIDGRIAASTLSPGEIVTEFRLVGSELTADFVPKDTEEASTMVAVRLADPSVIPLLRHGDTVTVIAHSPDSESATTISSGGRVVMAENARSEGSGRDSTTILIALPENSARAVAAASLETPLAVVLTGDRAG